MRPVIRLTKVELRRLFARRLTLIGLAAAILVIGAILLFAVHTGVQAVAGGPAAGAARSSYDQKD